MTRTAFAFTDTLWRRAASGCAIAALLMVGCGEPKAKYSTNRIYMRLQEEQSGESYAAEQVQAVANVMEAMFGTPDEVSLPAVEGSESLLDVARVQAAAGPVHSDQYGDGAGLYRQHCVHCHGITGNGRGPTAEFLNPYPRDFTRGTFKFKSTPVGSKPTHEDLRTILMNGVAGTAMPSFALLSEGEVESLVQYVRFLAIRGETERRLIEAMGSGDFYNSEDPAENESLLKQFEAPEFLVDEVLTEVVASWQESEAAATEVPERPAQYDRFSAEFDGAALAESVDRGRKLYYTSTANCYSCHGPSQLGDGQMTDYDQWTKEFFDWTKLADENYDVKLNEYSNLGGLPPRNIIPRNLRSGIYRGGRRPVDIFWRIANGIDGTPMPAANRAALSDDDIWDIVNFVLSLPYDATSQPGMATVTNPHELN